MLGMLRGLAHADFFRVAFQGDLDLSLVSKPFISSEHAETEECLVERSPNQFGGSLVLTGAANGGWIQLHLNNVRQFC